VAGIVVLESVGSAATGDDDEVLDVTGAAESSSPHDAATAADATKTDTSSSR